MASDPAHRRRADDATAAASASAGDGTARPAAGEPETESVPGARRWPSRDARRRRERKRPPWWELPALVVVAVLVAIVVKTFLIQPYYIPSGSMETTLHGCEGCSGDRIIVDKPVYTVIRDPHPGDIVVFRAPDGWDDEAPTTSPPSNPVLHAIRWFGQLVGVVPPDETDLVKRVIAVGGQTVKCCDARGNVQIGNNGPAGPFTSLNDSSYVFEDAGAVRYGRIPFGPLTVPHGRLWVMGDHRNNSKDSRYYCGAPPAPETTVCADASTAIAATATVPTADVIGKAVVIAWPPSRWTTLGTPATFESDHLPDTAAGPLDGGGLGAAAPVASGLVAAAALRRRRPGR